MNTQKKGALAARYRPQTFSEVAGQDLVKAVLSRASLADSPAAAYLFSGTRGVGKTTIARIFAKALNCEHAPCAEPCTSCEACQKIMQGAHVDVVEIDGASNNGVEDIRALRENVGYAPMEGRYKIFIIDEAHMLSNSAFNALLKTLEEPPSRVVFILATTEAHKFPVTIVSRCQHFTFRHLNEDELAEHLVHILHKENIPFDDDSVHLIAKRAEGSVRDSMSLLDQTLALGERSLQFEVTRTVLGLAGHAFFSALLDAIRSGDCATVLRLNKDLMRQGVDIGFFLRELGGFLRTLFLFEQAGSAILPSLELTPQDQSLVQKFAHAFPKAYLHASWQLVLEGRRSVVLSTEPAQALELLLLNLTLLPNLIPVSALSFETKQEVCSPVMPSQKERIVSPLQEASALSSLANAERETAFLPETENPGATPKSHDSAGSLQNAQRSSLPVKDASEPLSKPSLSSAQKELPNGTAVSGSDKETLCDNASLQIRTEESLPKRALFDAEQCKQLSMTTEKASEDDGSISTQKESNASDALSKKSETEASTTDVSEKREQETSFFHKTPSVDSEAQMDPHLSESTENGEENGEQGARCELSQQPSPAAISLSEKAPFASQASPSSSLEPVSIDPQPKDTPESTLTPHPSTVHAKHSSNEDSCFDVEQSCEQESQKNDSLALQKEESAFSVSQQGLYAEDDLDLGEGEDDDFEEDVLESAVDLDWHAFCDFCFAEETGGRVRVAEKVFRSIPREMIGIQVQLKPKTHVLYEQLKQSERFFLERLVAFLHNPNIILTIVAPKEMQSSSEMIGKLMERPELAPCIHVFDAVVEKCRER